MHAPETLDNLANRMTNGATASYGELKGGLKGALHELRSPGSHATRAAMIAFIEGLLTRAT